MSNTITDNTTVDLGEWVGGEGTLLVQGTWDGATVDLQFSINSGTNKTAVGSDTTLTADGGGNFQLPGGTLLYVVPSATGGSTSLSYVVGKSEYANR